MSTRNLIDLACSSALLQILHTINKTSAGAFNDMVFLSDRFFPLLNTLETDMRLLGMRHHHGLDDIRLSPYWDIFECKKSILEGYEQNRRVVLKELTPMCIYDCMIKGNLLAYGDWAVVVGGSREVTETEGKPAYEARIWLSPPRGELIEFSSITRTCARDIYATIMGEPFNGVDTLGDDPQSPPMARIPFIDYKDYVDVNLPVRLITADVYASQWAAFVLFSKKKPKHISRIV